MKILLFVLALWAFMSIAPSDGKDVRRYYGKKGTICKKGHHWIVKIKCTNKCKIHKPKAAFEWGGKVRITGRIGKAFRQKKRSCGRNCFCAKTSRKNQVFCKNHKGKKIKSNRVHFDIWCIKKTTNLRFRAYVKNIYPKMMKPVKKCPSGQNRHEDGVCRECANKEYKNNADVCTPCNCGVKGSKFQSCKTTSGDCTCNAGYKDRDCKNCKDQYYKEIGKDECKACGCNNAGTTNGGKCGADGKCTCDTANYQGDKCDQCKDAAKKKHEDGVCRKCNSGKYDDGAGNCKACNCGVKGSKFQSCKASSGDCTCKDGYQDKDCDNCQDKFYKKGDECLACGCDPDGSQNSGNCVANTGVCTCKVEATGDKCDGCASTHYKPAAGGACVACACDTGNTKGGVDSCDNTGQCPCVSGKTAKDCSS